MKKPLIIGKIGSAYGILGWNTIHSYTEKKCNILKYIPWFLKKNNQYIKLEIEKYKVNCKNIIVKIKNINNRNQAQKITNKIIIISSESIKSTNNHEYYWKDIITCKVFDMKKKYFGTVENIIRSIHNDILVIKKKKKTLLIPFIEKIFINKIKLDIKTIYIKTENL
ncbi:ribosome maturation factor RimM [Buchnera aphidicola]|uniref:ribosome maturation factor RimM n=1 Tax=Buchnera aphidicola TaxID=9 RepID=UPI0034638D90